MKIDHLKIEKLGQVSSIEINGEKAEKVLDYNISISAYGDSELNITFDISDTLTEVELEDGKTSNAGPIPIAINRKKVT